MRIATWNINGLRTRTRRDELLSWLRQNRPDVMGLQETKTDDDQFRECYRAAFKAEGYCAAFHGEPDRNGVAILSRHPLNVTQRGLPEQEGPDARLLAANTAGLSFTTVCVPSASRKGAGGMERKLAWLDALGKYLSEREDVALPAVLCGDFNVTPERLDNWNRERETKGAKGSPGFGDDERSRIRSLREADWFDLVREANPGRGMFSWWKSSDLYVQNKGLRMDLVFGNRAVFEGLRCASTDRSPLDQRDNTKTKKWDHAPVIVDLA